MSRGASAFTGTVHCGGADVSGEPRAVRSSDCVLCTLRAEPREQPGPPRFLSACPSSGSGPGNTLGPGEHPGTRGAHRDTEDAQGPGDAPGLGTKCPCPQALPCCGASNSAVASRRPASGRARSGRGAGPQSHLGLLLKAARGAFVFPDPLGKGVLLGRGPGGTVSEPPALSRAPPPHSGRLGGVRGLEPSPPGLTAAGWFSRGQ